MSSLPSNVHVMALTATATACLRQSVTQTLAMQNSLLIEVSPDKANIKYIVSEYCTIEDFSPLLLPILPSKSLNLGV